ncbi:hypothetical protein EIP86_000557 [Pleurotus ostreatoroseus]|nr:hypothetical protein EIP86_000557 [Pleurotus ostreatoroseus]
MQLDDVVGPDIESSKDFWFSDGNVVLIAEDLLQKKDIAFRVHKGVLARHSAVFRDMFEVPQPNMNEIELHQGLPVVRVSEVAQEIACILEILYDGGRLFFDKESTLPFSTCISALTLGSKYFLASIRKEALRRLLITFPTSRTDFNRIILAPAEHEKPPIEIKDEDAILVVNAAKALDIISVLPSAYYLCAQLPIRQLINGVVDDFGKLHRLSPEDLELCLKARDVFPRAQYRALRCLMTKDQVSPDCKHAATRRCAAAVLHIDPDEWGFPDLQALHDWHWYFKDHVELCSSCQDHFISLHRGKLDKIWVMLGSMFGVTPWPPNSQVQEPPEMEIT